MGRRRRAGRGLDNPYGFHGILVIDKPAAVVSMRVVERVRYLLKVRRAGHAGTLDPAATGVLPICIGQATRISSLILGDEKEYRATVLLGVETNTGDLDGEVTQERDPPDESVLKLDSVVLLEVLAQLTGVITQKPPVYSAIRVDGERLYTRARRGEAVEAPVREVVVHELELLNCRGPELEIRVRCSKGTYIRSLAVDIGQKLGCGGCLKQLRRTRVGALDLDKALTFEELEEHLREETIGQVLIPMAEALRPLPSVTLLKEASSAVLDGQLVKTDHIQEQELPRVDTGDFAMVLDPDGRLLALAEPRNGSLQPRRVFK